MTHIFNKIIILLCCMVFALSNSNPDTILLPLIISITISALTSYFVSSGAKVMMLICCIVISMLLRPFMYFLPLLCYDDLTEDIQFMVGLITLPLILHYSEFNGIQLFLILILMLVSYILKKHSTELLRANADYIQLRDETADLLLVLENKNKELMEKQDYEVNLATLNERNRIAREIHDNIGHALASSILQVGALLAITTDEQIKEPLNTLKETLSSGMDNIRHSIHNIHEESLDLEATLSGLVHDFTFCKTHLDYNVSNDFSMKAKYSIVYIIKEALSNIMKHSNATLVTISINEHPGLYQIIINDNGRKYIDPLLKTNGMGLASITNRITTLDGSIHIDTDKGFLIFITLPKELL